MFSHVLHEKMPTVLTMGIGSCDSVEDATKKCDLQFYFDLSLLSTYNTAR